MWHVVANGGQKSIFYPVPRNFSVANNECKFQGQKIGSSHSKTLCMVVIKQGTKSKLPHCTGPE